MIIERYTWEDAVIEAERQGLISAGAVNMCLRLAKAINWVPTNRRKGQPSGLYWKNEEALQSVGSSRATYYRYREELFKAGLFTEDRGNLIPLVPDLSQPETNESQPETGKSQPETDLSQPDNPYSEDTYSEDSYTDKTYSVSAAAGASAQVRDKDCSSSNLPYLVEPSLIPPNDPSFLFRNPPARQAGPTSTWRAQQEAERDRRALDKLETVGFKRPICREPQPAF